MGEFPVPNQADIWNEKYANSDHLAFRDEGGSPFARQVESILRPSSIIVDLGTGVGRDALYFAENGHEVIAADFSKVVIEQDRQALDRPDLQFMVSDISDGLPFKSESVDVVFARLSLHYYDNKTTKSIFRDISRILIPGGILAFACKTTNDPEYGQGTEIENDFFIFPNGHARHFFTEIYAEEVMRGLFTVATMKEVKEDYADKSAAFVHCVARKATI
jgi:ubiquinone/menaquinone biosynthesis C-methylase UbiE